MPRPSPRDVSRGMLVRLCGVEELAEFRHLAVCECDDVAPVAGNLLNPKDHASGNQRRSRVEFARFGLTTDENLHVTATDIHNQHLSD